MRIRIHKHLCIHRECTFASIFIQLPTRTANFPEILLKIVHFYMSECTHGTVYSIPIITMLLNQIAERLKKIGWEMTLKLPHRIYYNFSTYRLSHIGFFCVSIVWGRVTSYPSEVVHNDWTPRASQGRLISSCLGENLLVGSRRQDVIRRRWFITFWNFKECSLKYGHGTKEWVVLSLFSLLPGTDECAG